MKRAFCFSMLALALAGWGWGAADTRPLIACFGDSLTAGLGLEPGQSYPDVLQKELERRAYHYRVANFGVSGDTTQDGLARLTMVLADKPALVVLEFGANDGLRGLPVSITQRNLAAMIGAFQKAGVRVVLAGILLPPNYGDEYLKRFQGIYPALAAQYRVPLIPEPYTFMPDFQRSIALPDGSITSSFLDLYGRPPRDTGIESERNNKITDAQRLHLLNSTHIQRKLQQSPVLQAMMREIKDPDELVTQVFLTVLSRYPTGEEWKLVQAHSSSGAARGQAAVVDLAWALINSTEFQYRH